MEIVLVRHAESTSNVSRRWQGQGDAPLSSHGEAQAAALGARIAESVRAGWRVDEIVSSDLMRAARTGRASFENVATDSSWREADVGAWEGLTRAEVAARFPEELAGLFEGRSDVSLGGGESIDRFWARVDSAFDTLRARLPADGRAVVFSHGGVIGALVARVLGKRSQRPPLGFGRIANTGMTTLHFDATHPRGRVVGLNDTAHLGLHAVAAEERRDGALPVVRFIATEGAALSPESEELRIATATRSRETVHAALRVLVDRAGGVDVTLRLEPHAVHATALVLAHVPQEHHAALIVPPHASHSHILLDVRSGATLIDHAISAHKG